MLLTNEVNIPIALGIYLYIYIDTYIPKIYNCENHIIIITIKVGVLVVANIEHFSARYFTH